MSSSHFLLRDLRLKPSAHFLYRTDAAGGIKNLILGLSRAGLRWQNCPLHLLNWFRISWCWNVSKLSLWNTCIDCNVRDYFGILRLVTGEFIPFSRSSVFLSFLSSWQPFSSWCLIIGLPYLRIYLEEWMHIYIYEECKYKSYSIFFLFCFIFPPVFFPLMLSWILF